MTPFSSDAYQLMHDGALAFADIEATGIRVDVPYLKKQYAALTRQLAAAEKALWRTPEMRRWKSRFKDKTNTDSNTQLSTLLFKELGYRPTKVTTGGSRSVDDEALRKIGTLFTRTILAKRKLIKMRDTYISGLLREQTGSLLHPSFNLHMVVSFRSSSDGPNFQNVPVRDPEQGGVIRRAFLPLEPDHQFGEIDYKGNEVVSNACYNKDPNLIAYISDPTKDMHRDGASECFMLPLEQVSDPCRECCKGDFTFAEFYGSYWKSVAPALWNDMIEQKLTTKDGVPLQAWLAKRSIRELGQVHEVPGQGERPSKGGFYEHIQQVEDHFWNVRFPTYAKWKKDWYDSYLERGYFDLLTGFRCQGPMRRNEATNYPGQGTGFHFTLWSLIQIHRWLTVNEMRTRLLGQIHDNLVFSFHKDETAEVLRKAQQISCSDIRKHWPWIIAPMRITAKVAPVGATWYDVEKTEIEA